MTTAENADRHAIVVALRQVQRLVADHARAVSRQLGLSVTQLQALRAIASLDPATPRAVAAELGRTPSTMTGVLDQLERRGLVSRHRDADDRRRVLLTLTASASEMVQSGPKPLHEAMADGLDALGADEVAALREAMETLVRLLDAHHSA